MTLMSIFSIVWASVCALFYLLPFKTIDIDDEVEKPSKSERKHLKVRNGFVRWYLEISSFAALSYVLLIDIYWVAVRTTLISTEVDSATLVMGAISLCLSFLAHIQQSSPRGILSACWSIVILTLMGLWFVPWAAAHSSGWWHSVYFTLFAFAGVASGAVVIVTLFLIWQTRNVGKAVIPISRSLGICITIVMGADVFFYGFDEWLHYDTQRYSYLGIVIVALGVLYFIHRQWVFPAMTGSPACGAHKRKVLKDDDGLDHLEHKHKNERFRKLNRHQRIWVNHEADEDIEEETNKKEYDVISLAPSVQRHPPREVSDEERRSLLSEGWDDLST